MKQLLLIVFASCSVPIFAQNTVFSQAKIENVRVYYNSAELNHKTQAKIPNGLSELVITNVANHLIENTVQIRVPKTITVMSVQFTNAYIEEYDNHSDAPHVKSIKDEIEKKEREWKDLQNQLATVQQSVSLLDSNKGISTSSHFSVAELSKWLDYYKVKRTDLSNEAFALEKSVKTAEQELNQLKGKLTFSETGSEKTSQGKLIVQLMSSQETNASMDISYLTNNAGWTPTYEMRIENTASPMQMVYKANVRQSTGVEWKNVKLALTSGRANQSTNAPVISQPWFLDYQEDIRNTLYEYEGVQADAPQTVRASSKSTGRYDSDRNTMSHIDNYTTINTSQLNMTFDIDLPYTVSSNNKPHSVSLKETSLPATYEYIAVPRLDTDVYLVAKVNNYASYDILPGEATIILEGMYVGKTQIAPNEKDELSVSLGKDSNISVSRNLISENSGTRTLSSRKIQDYVYEITLKNNKRVTLELTVEDQYPRSANSDIEVNLTEKSGASADGEKGILSWKVNLKPNESKKIRWSYQVKSNKDKKLAG